ncbi:MULTISPECIES: hypothetical protein [Nonomuraea]|uniref:Uncharacterized protein n=1 Tax=Nonomuraea composti TaxID=2720023 RepID=A0ABX1BKF4_9ACTN|nr:MULTISPECIES: hypothetical protein [unclassified Nonomuraea]NJP95278.1 hypothetical protein [Nonomuraea sp. FMUSA5-5]
MGRHAKPCTPREQEPQDDSGKDEHRPSKGRHAKEHPRRTPGEPAESRPAG